MAGACSQQCASAPALQGRPPGLHLTPCRQQQLVRQLTPAAQVLKRLPNLKKLDGAPVEVEEREAVLAARA